VSEDVLVSKITGIARLDQLMEELMLEGWGGSKYFLVYFFYFKLIYF